MNVDQGFATQELSSFLQIAEFLPTPLVVLHQSGQCRFQNAAFRDFLSLPAATEPEHWLPEYEHRAFHGFIQEQFRQFVSAGFVPVEETLPHRFHLLCGQGKQRVVEIETRLLQEAQERYLALFFKEITATPRNSRKYERQRQFRNILDNTGAVIYIKNTVGCYQYVNQLFEQLFHIEKATIQGKTDFDIFDPPIAEQFVQSDRLVLETGQVLRIQEVAAHDDGFHTYISVKFPLRDITGKIIGVAGISTDITEQLWAEQEIRAAHAVQNLLYPKHAPQCPSFEIAGAVSPAEITSGDYYDYIRLSPTRLVIAVGDVSGHGLGPALEMVETRAYLRAILRTEVRLDVTMECLNEFLYRDLRDSAFVTLFLVELDLQNKTFRYVGAGHKADLLKASGKMISLKSTGLMLGILSNSTYRCSPEIAFKAGDILLLSTDGITEAKNQAGDLYGTKRMVQQVYAHALQPADRIVERLIHSARQFAPGRTQADDMTAVIIKCLE